VFLATYPGYTLDSIGEMDEDQYLALARRIPHVWKNHPIGALVQQLRALF